MAATLEEAIQLTPAQVDAVAAFLRVIHAVENGRSATAYATWRRAPSRSAGPSGP